MRYLTQYKPAGTRSFRLASAQLFGFGGNAQNNDKDSMDIFQAPPGWKFVQRDQSGAEALIVAYLCRPGRYRNLFIHGVKPHTYVALHLFIDKFRGNHPKERYWLKDPTELKALPEWPHLNKVIKDSKFEYDIGKRTGHASNYKMGPNTFRESTLKESEGSLVLSYADAQFYLATYKDLFPEIVVWQAEIEKTVRAHRLLRNLYGFPRRFERELTDSYIREAISWIPQSTVGCITHEAFEKTCVYIREHNLDWRPISNKHDSFALMVRDTDVNVARDVMKAHLNVTLQGTDSAFTMASDFQVGQNLKKWSDYNPYGMKEAA